MSAPVVTVLVWALAVFSAFILIILVAQSTGRRIPGIWTRVFVQIGMTAWILIPALISGWPLRLVLTATAVLGSWELTGVLRDKGVPLYRGPVLVATAACCLLATSPNPRWFLSVPMVLAVGCLFAPVLGVPLQHARERAGLTLLAFVWPGLCMAYGVHLETLGNWFGDLLFLYAVLEVNDAAGFVGGRLFQGRKLAPTISPNKTVSGAVAGLVCAAGLGGLLSFLLPDWCSIACVGLGFVLGCLGQLADLAASAIKRELGIKDFANTIPTQGGILDIYDAFILVLPLWFLGLSIWR